MQTRVLWTPQASEDLLNIYVTIGLDNPAAAERLYDAIEARISNLQLYPRSGERRPEIRPSTRMLVEKPYVILYATEPDTDSEPVESVVIVRIVDGRRDLLNMF